MYLQSKNRYLKTTMILGVLVSLGSISSANARGHTHHKWVVHDVYIVDTRPPLIATVPVEGSASRCQTPVSNAVVPAGGNYGSQHKFLVNDDGITTDQQANPHAAGQQVQLNYYDE